MYSTVESVALRRYYMFAIFNVVIVFLLGGTFVDSFRRILEGSASLYDTLGNSIPKVTGIAIQTVIASADDCLAYLT